jgi:uncharacterized protein (DUF2141 family)
MRCSVSRLLLAFIASAVLNISLPAAAQSTGAVRGVVVDETGAVVQGARVTISDMNGGARGSAVTKGDGSFSVNGLSPGRYRISAESGQFEGGESTVEITDAGQPVSLTL